LHGYPSSRGLSFPLLVFPHSNLSLSLSLSLSPTSLKTVQPASEEFSNYPCVIDSRTPLPLVHKREYIEYVETS
jgi:hypothetical protein